MRYELGGRAFVHVGESTVEHDYTFLALQTAAGLDVFDMQVGESPEVFAERLVRQVIASGKALPLLGCLLVPEPTDSQKPAGEAWTPEMGEKTARFLGTLTAEKDKAQVRSLIATLLIDFFQSGLASVRTTAMSSSNEAGPRKSESAPASDMALGPS